MQRRALFVLLCASFLGACRAQRPASEIQSPETARASGPILVASDLDNRPFAYVDEDGKPAGRDVRMMELLARELGRELIWQRMPFDQLLPAAEAGVVDVVCASTGITAERATRVRFTRPYFETSICLLVRAEDGGLFWERGFEGRTVTGGAGTTSELAVRAKLPKARHVFENKTGLASSERLTSREVDAVAMDRPAAEAAAAASRGVLMCWSDPLADEDYALALPLDRKRLAGELSAALEHLGPEMEGLNREYDLSTRARYLP